MIDEKKLIEVLKEYKIDNVSINGKSIVDIINEQPQADKWIPCEERLPELDEGTEYFKQSKPCLVALEWWDGEISESVGWYNQNGFWSDDSKNCKVIAWKPIQPYKKEGAE